MRSRTIMIAYLLWKRLRKHQRRYRVHPWNRDREISGEYVLKHKEISEDPKKFKEYYKMNIETYNELLKILYNRILSKTSSFRRGDEITPEEKLTLTLRYLATGTSFHGLCKSFKLGNSTMATQVRNTCRAIIDLVGPKEMALPSTYKWLTLANDFENYSDFPNCVGAMDARRIRLSTAKKKLKHNPVFIFIAEPNLSITAMQFCPKGGESFGKLLAGSELGRSIADRKLNLPKTATWQSENIRGSLPYVFAASETFCLTDTIMKPYPAWSAEANTGQRIFNFRLHRARRYAENTYGVLANKWLWLKNPPNLTLDFAEMIVKTICILHNFVVRREGYDFEDSLYCDVNRKPEKQKGSTSRPARRVRERFTDYFLTPEGSVDYQEHLLLDKYGRKESDDKAENNSPIDVDDKEESNSVIEIDITESASNEGNISENNTENDSPCNEDDDKSCDSDEGEVIGDEEEIIAD